MLWIVIIALSLWPSDSALVSPPEADLASCPRPKSIQCIKDKIKLARHFQKIRDTYLADVNRRYHLLHNLNLVTYKLRSTFRKNFCPSFFKNLYYIFLFFVSKVWKKEHGQTRPRGTGPFIGHPQGAGCPPSIVEPWIQQTVSSSLIEFLHIQKP